MVKALLIVALLAAPSAATERLKGYVKRGGVTYAVIETTTTKQQKPRNDRYTRAMAGYLTANYGKSSAITIKPTVTKRTLYVPIR